MICQDLIAKKGIGSKYAKDCQIRAVRGRPFPEAAAILGWTDPPPIVIRAGIGTLVLGDVEEFTPAPTIGSMAKSFASALIDRTPAEPDEVERRLAICHACVHWSRDRCGACGCWTKAKTALKSQSCPSGKW